MVPAVKLVKLSPPEVRNSDIFQVSKAVRQRQLSQGSFLAQFESSLSKELGVQHVMTVSSCTTGLQLILSGLGLEPGDEVIVPNFTFPATINTVIQERLQPVLVDINIETFCMDIESFRDAIGPKTKAVIVVHAFGYPAAMQEILDVVANSGIYVIEDAACAIGSKIDGKAVGSFGTASAFSFHPRKVLTTGEGGAVVTNDSSLAEKLKVLRSHGGVRGQSYMSFIMPGFNFRMSDINAALGLAQLPRLSRVIKRRNSAALQYQLLLSNFDTVTTPNVADGVQHTFQSYVVLLSPNLDRDKIIVFLRTKGIETTLGTYALSEQPAYRESAKSPVDLDKSVFAFRHSLALPMSSTTTKRDRRRVVKALREAIESQTSLTSPEN
jgi:dTDP-4-amino-4,6-dideoxygalactose transaminase